MASNGESVRKVALITGASSGIGATTAIHFASLGYRLALHARNVPVDQEGLAETKTRCLQANPKLTSNDIFTMNGDLAREDECQNLVENAIKEFKRLDVLVANAGILSSNKLETLKMDEFDKVMNVNCRSVVLLNKLVIPYLTETKGNIVNVSSAAGLRAVPDMFAYCLSKAAVVQLTRCAALELGSKGIRVNAVCPGVIGPTRLIANAGLPEAINTITAERVKNTYPLGRVGTTEEVAKSIAFLASEDQASYMTGVTLSIDGGRCVS